MSFHRLERDAWQSPSVARAYSEGFLPVTVHLAEPLLRAVRAGAGTLLADVACGPGTVAHRAAALGSRVVAVDFSRAMLEMARRGPEGLLAVQGSATRLPLAPGTFDAVVSNFGLLHFPAPDRAIAEAVEALRPGGRAAWSVWGEDAVALKLIPQCIEALGLHPSLPAGPGFFQFGAPGPFAAALRAAGLEKIETHRFSWDAKFPDTDAFWRTFEEGTARTRASIRALAPAERRDLRAEVDRQLQGFRSGSGLAVPTSALLAVGARPLGPAGAPSAPATG